MTRRTSLPKAFNALLDSEEWKNKLVIGLSATPWTRGMGLRWKSFIIAATMKQLIADGILSPYEVFGPDCDTDYSGVKRIRNKYGEVELQESSLAAVVNKKEIIADVVKMWHSFADGLSSFLFAVNCAHARSLQLAFQEDGVPWGYIDADTKPEERKALFRAYHKREIIGISSVGCLTTGIDADVRAIVDAQKVLSEKTHVQKLGRLMRRAEGKEFGIVLDHAGNCESLGYPDDIHHELLDDRKPHERTGGYEEEPPIDKPRKCKQCYRLIPPRAKKCTACGFVPPLDLDHGVETRDGELKKKTRKEPKPDMQVKQDWYSGLLWIANQKGHSVGAAYHNYKRKFGVAPAKLNRVRAHPSEEMWKFVNDGIRKFKKERKAQ